MYLKYRVPLSKIGMFILILGAAEGFVYLVFVRGAPPEPTNLMQYQPAPLSPQPVNSIPESQLSPPVNTAPPSDYRDLYTRHASSTPSVKFNGP